MNGFKITHATLNGLQLLVSDCNSRAIGQISDHEGYRGITILQYSTHPGTRTFYIF